MRIVLLRIKLNETFVVIMAFSVTCTCVLSKKATICNYVFGNFYCITEIFYLNDWSNYRFFFYSFFLAKVFKNSDWSKFTLLAMVKIGIEQFWSLTVYMVIQILSDIFRIVFNILKRKRSGLSSFLRWCK